MSTRARIGIEDADGNVESIYTHFDGYPSNHVPILTERYADPARLRELLALGDLSILDRDLGAKHDFDMPHQDRVKLGPWCLAYGRDRGESNVGSKTHRVDNWPDYGQNYEYLLRADGWYGRQTTYKVVGDTYIRTEAPWEPAAKLLADDLKAQADYAASL